VSNTVEDVIIELLNNYKDIDVDNHIFLALAKISALF